MIRIFIAIDIPRRIKEEISFLKMGIPSASWTSEENIHLTLRFIGEVQEPYFRELRETLKEIKFAPFDLILQGVGFFKYRSVPRVLWVGLQKNEQLMQLYRKIEVKLIDFGLPQEEKKFSPHITIARFDGNSSFYRVGDFIQQYSLFKSTVFKVQDFHLYSSKLTPKSAIHFKEETYKATATLL